MTKSKRITIPLNDRQKTLLKGVCEQTKLSRSKVIDLILNDYLKLYELNVLKNG
jgi:hypothetical protein